MPNPIDNCRDCTEWVELYITQTNLTLILDAGGKNNTLYLNQTGYVVITRNKTQFLNFWNINETQVIEGKLSLNNNGDYVSLYNISGELLDNLSYPKIAKNKSYAKINGTWFSCKPTPGEPNNCTIKKEKAKLEIYLSSPIIVNQTYTSLFNIKIKNKNCSIKDNVTIYYFIRKQNETVKEGNFTREIGCSGYANTGNWTPTEEGSFEICGKIIGATNETICKNISVIRASNINCDLEIKIYSPLIWNSSEKERYYIFVNDSLGNYLDLPVEISYWIEDFFGNYERNPYTTKKEVGKNFSRDFTPKLDCGLDAYLIKANITNPYCNDTNLSNNFAEKLIVVITEKRCEPKVIEKVVYRTKYTERKTESKPLEIEILDLAREVFAGSEFTTRIKLKNLENKEISFELYSYAYNGSDCITGSWTENRREITLGKREEKIVELRNKIEDEVESGEYNFKVRAKFEGKNFDVQDKILVKEKIKVNRDLNSPKLEIKTDKKIRINLINCSKCKMIITGPNFTIITSKHYRVFDKQGEYKIFVIRNGEVIINRTYFWLENETENLENEIPEKKITGKSYERNIIETVVSTLKSIFMYFINLMESSLKS
jgi:hypothetical protein